MDINDCIGYKNSLPWRIKEDLKYFRKVTLNSAVIMGRKTYNSIGKALDNRLNIVLSRNGLQAGDVYTAKDFNHALHIASMHGYDEVFVIGGVQIYELALPLASHIYLTRIMRTHPCDAWFPNVNWNEWFLIYEEEQSITLTTQRSPLIIKFQIFEKGSL